MISTANKVFGLSMARRRSRQWLVIGYWCMVGGFLAAFSIHEVRHRWNGFAVLVAFQVIVSMPALLGGVRASGAVKPYRGVKWAPLCDRDDVQTVFGQPKPELAGNLIPEPDLDERERHERDRIHFVAYTLVRWLALAMFAVYGLLGLIHADWLSRLGPLFFFLITFLLWSLPQTLILWTEPDMEAAG
jgi:hypothetical protein